MIYIDRELPDITKTELMARAILDKRLNARDLKVYSYVMYFSYISRTQEEIADMLDISRSNINKSLEKLTAFNYIEKTEIRSTKQMIYEAVKRDGNPGIPMLRADNVMRLGNLTKQKDMRSFNWMSSSEFYNLEKELKLIKEDIEVLKKIDDEVDEDKIKSLVRKLRITSYKYIKYILEGKVTAQDVIEELKYTKKNINEKLEDTRYIEKELNKFKKSYPSNSTVLTEEEVLKVLEDENALFILFLDNFKDKRIVRFKEKYLEDYIKFLCRFTELAKNRNFFKLYYENKIENFVFEDLMKVAEEKHREVPRIRGSFRFTLSKALGDLHRNMIEVNEELNEEIVKESLLDEVEVLADEIYGVFLSKTEAKGRIDGLNILGTREFLLCAYSLELEKRFEESYAISFEDFMKMFDIELYEELKKYEGAKVKLNIEKMKQEENE